MIRVKFTLANKLSMQGLQDIMLGNFEGMQTKTHQVLIGIPTIHDADARQCFHLVKRQNWNKTSFMMNTILCKVKVKKNCVKWILYVKPKISFQFLDNCFKFIR